MRRLKLFLPIVYLLAGSCSSKYSNYSKFNKVQKEFICEISNSNLNLNFKTNGDYDFYSGKKFSPSKNYCGKIIDQVLEGGYKILIIGETNTPPFFTLVVQHSKKPKENSNGNYQRKLQGFDILSTTIVTKENYYIFTLIHDSNQPKDLYEDFTDLINELTYTTSSVKESIVSKN